MVENKDFEALIRQYDRRMPFFIVTRPITKQRDITKWCSAGRTMSGSVTCLGESREMVVVL